MKILVIGSGGREHALVWKISQSPKVEKIYCAPGNGGISQVAQCVDINPDDLPSLVKFAKDKRIDLTVVGPEAPLVAGIVDLFEGERLKVFGPDKPAALLEGSKVFAKEFMKKYGVPTAPFRSFGDIHQAKEFLKEKEMPLVIKADGLAAGKGVMLCMSLEEAEAALEQIMAERIFKEAGDRVIIEDCLIGEEASILVVSDGEHFVILESSQDHKRIFDGDLGPNTGGMGAYSPAPVVSAQLLERTKEEIIVPVIAGMKKEGTPFKGVLYVGVMITAEGPKVLEFNVRFGDPETQAVLPRLKSDLVDLMLASCDGTIGRLSLEWDQQACVCVVMSSKGYPGSYEKGKEISGLGSISNGLTVVFHAGTKRKEGKIITSGGRVLGVSSKGETIAKAVKNAYNNVQKIKFEGCFYRKDIGAKALKKN